MTVAIASDPDRHEQAPVPPRPGLAGAAGPRRTAAGNRRRRPQHALGGGLSAQRRVAHHRARRHDAHGQTRHQAQQPIQGYRLWRCRARGGLLDVVLDSDFARNRTLYFCFSEPGDAKTNSTALARAKLSEDNKRLSEAEGDLQPEAQGGQPAALWLPHRGGRRRHAFPEPRERFTTMAQAQTLDNHLGKVVRIGRTAASLPTTLRRHARRAARRSGATATATPKAW